MAFTPPDTFMQGRSTALDGILSLIQKHIDTTQAPLVTDIRSITLSDSAAKREAWLLINGAVCHLKDGAPGHTAGSMAEALSKISLRSSSLAASLGVKPPQFEQMLFQVDYTDGHEAAVFLCRRLIDAAEGDISKSRQIIAQKIFMEKPELSAAFAQISKDEIIALKKQMALSFDLLLETYTRACRDMQKELGGFTPAPAPTPSRPSPHLSGT